MSKSGEKPGAFAAIVNGIFVENFSQRISRGLRHQVDSEVASHSSSVGVPTLSPIWRDSGMGSLRSFVCLLVSSGDHRADNRIRTERIECEILQFFPFRRAMVGESHVHGA